MGKNERRKSSKMINIYLAEARKKLKIKQMKAVRVVLYELQMFFHSYERYAEFLKNEQLCHKSIKNSIENNIFIEIFLLHSRVLYEFYYLSGKNKDDILVSHFLTDRAFKQFKKKRTPKIFIDKIFPWKKINKRLAHLTYYRLREKPPTTKIWDIGKIYLAIYKTTEAFILNTNDIIKKELFREYTMDNIIKDIFGDKITKI
ncbi:MAG: hypothetical protein ABH813_02130 [Patescibacteria group bacterium]